PAGRAVHDLGARHERRPSRALRPDPEEPVRRDPVVARRLRVPRLHLRSDARVEATGLAPLVADRTDRALPGRAIVRGRVHGQPLRRRPPDRLRVRHWRAARREVGVAAARAAGVAAATARPGRLVTGALLATL